jgi:hypothetical protein
LRADQVCRSARRTAAIVTTSEEAARSVAIAEGGPIAIVGSPEIVGWGDHLVEVPTPPPDREHQQRRKSDAGQ